MNILSVDNITKAYGERKLFDSASFFLQEGEKAGIIGVNGTGKSTLLQMIAGLEEPDEGQIIRATNKVIGYLPQHPQFNAEDTVLQAVLSEKHHSDNHLNLESDAKSMMTRLGITDFEKTCGHLSGGQRKRLALIKVLLYPCDILVLDEPTNHLDGEMADWLEDTLKSIKSAVIMVTHDRYFLDSVTSRIVEIDNGQIFSYETNYAGYLELKLQREEMQMATQRKQQSLLRTELEWVKRGARARSTKQKARLERYEELKNKEIVGVQQNVEIGSVGSRMGRTTIELSHISKAFDDKILIQDFSYIFLKDDRVGFIGKNGCGKTTLMRIIYGLSSPDSGTVTIGQTVNMSYYQQECDMTDDKRVIDYIREVAEVIDTKDGKITATQMLNKFLFAGEDQYGLIGKLSGGEKRRMHLCRILMGAPNVLILDEPTNDLDIATLTVLESYLDTFQGIVIVVSHDRYFLDRVVKRIFSFEEEGIIRQYEGGYSDYALRKKMTTEALQLSDNDKLKNNLPSEDNHIEKNNRPSGVRKLKFTYKEQKDYETIEADIHELEEKIETVTMEMSKYTSDFIKLQELGDEKNRLEAALEEKMDRWMYLEDLAARISAGEYQNE